MNKQALLARRAALVGDIQTIENAIAQNRQAIAANQELLAGTRGAIQDVDHWLGMIAVEEKLADGRAAQPDRRAT